MRRGDSVARYLAKRGDLDKRPLVGEVRDGAEMVVVIPALAERSNIEATLLSLARNPAEELGRTLVIVVVNNRVPGLVDDATIEDNRATLELLGSIQTGEGVEGLAGLRLAYVDASSPGCELADKEGVGMARKIGLDWGVSILRESGAEPGILVCLDADTLVDADYLEGIREHFSGEKAWAGTARFAHRLEGDERAREAIVDYELFLRSHVLGLRYAGSPYAFHTVGSTMACTAQAYAAVGGMNRRQAGEDFYFLQELAKTGRVETIASTTVRPSPRASWRVPFGTGRSIQERLDDAGAVPRAYHPESYDVLRRWLDCVGSMLGASAEALHDEASGIHEELGAYLSAQRFLETWPGLRRNARDDAALLKQFHRWFDGLKTLRLLHHLRDTGLGDQDTVEAIARLIEWEGSHAPVVISGGARNLEEKKCVLGAVRGIV